jgi:hypothetical protein
MGPAACSDEVRNTKKERILDRVFMATTVARGFVFVEQ